MELVKYQLNTTGEGFSKNESLVSLTTPGGVIEAPLDTEDQGETLDSLVDYFKILKYFPDVSFYLESPVELEFEISLDYILGQSVSGLCKTEADGNKVLNVWQAEHQNSSLFSPGENLSQVRNYLTKEDEKCFSGWMFYAPFLYQGIFTDRTLRKRVLIEMEKLIYLNQQDNDDPHKSVSVNINSHFSYANPCWNENIPVLEP